MKGSGIKLYTKLLVTFLKAGIVFGTGIGLYLGMLTNWHLGLIYGVLAGCCLWMGVPGILIMLSSFKKRSN